MRRYREPLFWLVAAVVAGWAIAVLFPRAFPLISLDASASRSLIIDTALERLRELGEPVDDAYTVTQYNSSALLERRLQLSSAQQDADGSAARLRDSWLAASLIRWEVVVYPPGARTNDWTYRARLDRDGEILGMRKQVPEEVVTPSPTEDEAQAQAWLYLEQHGFDRADFEPRPEFRRSEKGDRVNLTLEFRHREKILGDDFPYGIAVYFAGDELAGFGRWYDDPDAETVQRDFGRIPLLFIGNVTLYFLLTLLVAVPFLKRYHDGQLGVRRGIQLHLMCIVLGIVATVVTARGISQGTNFGLASRQQTTWVFGAIIYLFNYLTLAVLAFMAWSVGESLCRQRWPQKLAAFDAVFRLRWANATVGLSALRGVALGIIGSALLLVMVVMVRAFGAAPMAAFNYADNGASAFPALAWFGTIFAVTVPVFLLVFLMVPCALMLKLGERRGLLVAVIPASLLTWGIGYLLLPLTWNPLLGLVVAGIGLFGFRYGDFLTALLAGLFMATLPAVLPSLYASDPTLATHGWIPLLLLAAPLIASLRHVGTDHEFVYTYDDVPPHVRRIAERERQRVELETARGIQSAILPELPPQLNGVQIAHCYFPATEVGGDFYDVLALDDGRLAVAVGDVAGHGVSSGLVMSMAKSALAVQVTFDPAVESVVATLNRMVYQSARARLLTTLCYALVDPVRGEMVYASAGHLFPYRVSESGEVMPLSASAYPLGVRVKLETQVRTESLAPGDSIFLYSDGLVEARPHDSDEQFGFDRLEASLGRHAALPPMAMRDAVLGDVEAFTGGHPRDDDLTVLVLKIPA